MTFSRITGVQGTPANIPTGIPSGGGAGLLADPPLFGVNSGGSQTITPSAILTWPSRTVQTHGAIFCSLGVDQQTITFTEDCTIIISLELSVTAAGLATSDIVEMIYEIAGLRGTALYAMSGLDYTLLVTTPTGGGSDPVGPVWTTLAFRVSAGDNFQVVAGPNSPITSEVVHDTGTNLIIQRLA